MNASVSEGRMLVNERESVGVVSASERAEDQGEHISEHSHESTHQGSE